MFSIQTGEGMLSLQVWRIESGVANQLMGMENN